MAVPVQIVAITGGSGSGKTWLAQQLAAQLSAGRLAADDFYRDLSHLPLAQRDLVNFDHPDAIDWQLLRRTISRIAKGLPVALPDYDLVTHTRRPQTHPWIPRPLVLVDGLWLLRRAELRCLYSVSIFIECAEEVRLTRRLQRDQCERGRTDAAVRKQFREHVAPMHARFVAPQSRHADIVLDSLEVAARMEEIAGRLKRLLVVQTPFL